MSYYGPKWAALVFVWSKLFPPKMGYVPNHDYCDQKFNPIIRINVILKIVHWLYYVVIFELDITPMIIINVGFLLFDCGNN